MFYHKMIHFLCDLIIYTKNINNGADPLANTTVDHFPCRFLVRPSFEFENFHHFWENKPLLDFIHIYMMSMNMKFQAMVPAKPFNTRGWVIEKFLTVIPLVASTVKVKGNNQLTDFKR